MANDVGVFRVDGDFKGGGGSFREGAFTIAIKIKGAGGKREIVTHGGYKKKSTVDTGELRPVGIGNTSR